MSELKPVIRQSTTVPKGWGSELIFANNEKYCGKLLRFNAGSKFSMHYHLIKEETFYLLKGDIRFYHMDLTKATHVSVVVKEGAVIDIPVGCPHQIEALTDVVIVEVSTTHRDSDNYRICPGDSQK